MPLSLAIHGAAGRMGQRLIALAAADPALAITAALESPASSRLGQDAGSVAGIEPLGVPLTAAWATPPAVVIDFSVPAAGMAIARVCATAGVPLVLATTGLEPAEQAEIRQIATRIPLLWSPSMSLTVNLTMKLVELAARALADHPTGADVEILERHHRMKEDAPSGTALKFGQIVAAAMGQTAHVHGREGRPGKRPHGEIGYHAIRTGDNPGEHTIIFGLLGETLELTVRASNRDCYASGALAAAKFLAGKPPGLYGMQDVLGL
ncbi:MAG: 4-hydroxy-tetrahydrodipicolinate reductase [Pirellulales bacterium]|nr:4-hydroxy-tetrahydrodipicolinate reductase [Pirellulales bacterium]